MLKLIKAAALVAPMALIGCAGMDPVSRGQNLPALSALSVDFERAVFAPGARVSGHVARQQAATRRASGSFGKMRQATRGPIPTELVFTVSELASRGNHARMRGTLKLRDLAFGVTMAELPNFSGSGAMPKLERGANTTGLVFRAVEDEVLAWLSTLSCDTAARRCAPAARPAALPGTAGAAVSDGADLQLAALVGPRPSGIRKINSGGIDPNKVVAAATPVAPAPAVEGAAGPSLLGTTTAALGLLDRSGFWLQTPLVETEATGEVVNKANGRRLTVTLVPKDGPVGGGSQMSLAAMTELGASVTDLIQLDVFR